MVMFGDFEGKWNGKVVAIEREIEEFTKRT